MIPLESQIGLLPSRATLLLPNDLEFNLSSTILRLTPVLPNLSIFAENQPNVQFSFIFIFNAPNMSQEYFYIIIQYENIKKTKLPFFPPICLIYQISKYNMKLKVLQTKN